MLQGENKTKLSSLRERDLKTMEERLTEREQYSLCVCVYIYMYIYVYVYICIYMCVFLQDTTIEGFSVPRGQVVMYVSHAVHRDPEVFQQPDHFLPDRWTGR